MRRTETGSDWYIIEDEDDQRIGIRMKRGSVQAGAESRMRRVLREVRGAKVKILEIIEKEVPKILWGKGKGNCHVWEGRFFELQKNGKADLENH